MRQFLALCSRFRADERGAFLALFGILAVVIIAVSGAVVDYTSVQQARTRAQVALDAAALALQPRIYETGYDISGKAQALLINRIADTRIASSITNVATDTTNGELTLTARLTVPLYFVALVGIRSMSVEVKSKATRKKLKLEVMMVLDNSNSMDASSRMTNLIAAAKCAENILFNGPDACNSSTATPATATDVKIGIVPFTMTVNVGTSHSGDSWMDTAGISATARQNLDADDNEATAYAGPVNRITRLFGQISNVDWGGCVESRPHVTGAGGLYYDTSDLPASTATPDSLFVPLFSPDEPDTGSYHNNYLSDTPSSCNQTGTCSYTESTTSCNKAGTSCSGSTTTANRALTGPNTGTLAQTCSCSSYTQPATTGGTTNKNNWTRTRNFSCSFSYAPQGLSVRELQERMCKYNGSAASGVNQGAPKGPNLDCPNNAITPLTTNKATVTTAINALDPQGGTNIHSGVIWGFHALSPTAPFTEGGAYETTTSKVMIIMTDGENTAYKSTSSAQLCNGYNVSTNGACVYSFYGYPWNANLGTTASTEDQLETEMDTRTVTTCTNAKAAGITVYTIGLATASTSNQTKVETMLKKCSSGLGYYYFPAASSDLTAVFKTIADQLAALRIAQ